MKTFYILLILPLLINQALAATITWNGSVDSNWTDGTNWSTGNVPTASDDVIIPGNVPNDPRINAPVTVRSVDIQEGGSLEILSSGILQVSDAPSVGIYVQGTLTSNGNIYVNNTGSDGIYNEGVFNNEASASLWIGYDGGNIGASGIHTFGLGLFYNNGGNIWIDNCALYGVYNQFATFNNLDGGHLSIGLLDGAIVNGIYNAGSDAGFINDDGIIEANHAVNRNISNEGTFSNQGDGKITLGSSAGNGGIFNAATGNLINTDCAVLSTSRNIQNNGTTTNNAYFYFDTGQSQLNYGTFTNNGVVSFAQIPVFIGSEILNNDLIIAPVSRECALSDVLQIGSANDFAVAAEWYSDPEMTTQAAVYDAAANTLSLIGLEANTAYELYFITSGNGCTFGHVISVTLIDTEAPTAVCRNSTVELGPDGTYTLTAEDVLDPVNSFDNCGPVLVTSIFPDMLNCESAGLTNVTVKTADRNGNEGNTCQALVNLTIPAYAPGLRTWTGAGSSDWNLAANWSPCAVPTAGDSIVIPEAGNDPAIYASNNAVAKSVTLRENAGLTIEAAGSLTIGNATAFGLFNEGTIQNGGLISIDQVNDQGSISTEGPTGVGLFNVGPLVNNGVISIDNTANSGIFNKAATFDNAGQIHIGQSGGTGNIGYNGIESYLGTFHNQDGATVLVDNTAEHGMSLRQGSFINQGNIVIGQGGVIGKDAVFMDFDQTFDHQTGELLIDNALIGLNISGGTFHNYATIRIGQVGAITSVGVYVEAGATFENRQNSLLYVDNTGSSGITLLGGFANDGGIFIGQTAAVGGSGVESNLYTGQFVNKSDGSMTIDRTGAHGLNCIVGGFSNFGQISIGANHPIGGYGIRNGTTFTNEACASIQLYDNIFNQFGTFINKGLLTLNMAETHTAGDLSNQGIIGDVQGSFSGGANEEIIIAPAMGDCSGISPAFQLGADLDLDILGVFTDKAATQAAGDYDLSTNTFVPYHVLSRLFVAVEDPAGGCTQVVPWMIEFTGDSTLVLTEDPGESGHYYALSAIEARVIINAGLKIDYRAGEKITLSPGFHALAGAIFSAQIEACPDSDLRRAVPEASAIVEISPEAEPVQAVTSARESLLKVSPNPFSTTTFIHYDLPEGAPLQIFVTDLQGRRVATLLETTWQEAGTYRVEWHYPEGPSGLLILYFKTDKVLMTRKLIAAR